MNIISDALQAQSDAALHLLCFQALSVGGEAPYGTGGGSLIGHDAQCSKMGFHATAQFPGMLPKRKARAAANVTPDRSDR